MTRIIVEVKEHDGYHKLKVQLVPTTPCGEYLGIMDLKNSALCSLKILGQCAIFVL